MSHAVDGMGFAGRSDIEPDAEVDCVYGNLFGNNGQSIVQMVQGGRIQFLRFGQSRKRCSHTNRSSFGIPCLW